MNKTEFVTDKLTKRIHAGEFKPGEKLPSLRNLAKEYGVSTMVLRKAIDILEEKKLVESEPKSGLFIPLNLRQYELCGLITSVHMGTMDNYFEAFLQAAGRHNCIPMTVPAMFRDCIESMLEKSPRKLFLHAGPDDFPFSEISGMTKGYCPVFCNQFEWMKNKPDSAVLADWDYITEQTIRCFQKAGHQRILFVCHNEEPPPVKMDRLTRIGKKCGLKFGSPEFTWCSRFDFGENPARIEHLFRHSDPPTAAFATADSPLYDFMEHVRAYFPEHADMDCIGCYNSFWSNHSGKEFASWEWDWDEFWEMAFNHCRQEIEYYRPKLIKWKPNKNYQ